MTARGKLLSQVLAGRSDQSELIRWLGFAERIRGSHHVSSMSGVAEILNLQPRPDGTAKPYQVKQVRNLVTKYKLSGDSDAE
jgi:hypothetical protein